VTVPFALMIGAWAARRVTMPIENLRREALEKARGESPGANLTEHADDVGDLAAAMNTLLDAIAKRRADHEAFVADVVHEMKSPVAAITAVAEALESPVDDARRARLAKALSTSGKKLDDLVTHFLELARAEAGMPREEREEVDLGRLVRLETERAKDDVRYAQVDVVCRVPEGPVPVRGVARRLAAVVRELVDNAAQFAGEGGHVEVRLSSTTKLVVLEVEDDGPGIAEADLPKVFHRFFTTRGEKRGTGLGLALVHAVAQAHGGSAQVVSPVREGRGTTFRLTLPAA
jgi:signal transduction histidine kinase